MKKVYILFSIIFLVSFFISCSKVKKDIVEPETLSIHQKGISDPASPNFHGKLIKAAKWDMKLCQTCHGGNFNGGTVDESCYTCHKEQGGPLACNTCHGSFANPSRIAPPRDLNGNTSNTVRGVGAHARLLYDNFIGKSVNCNECHYVPSNYYDPKHIDTTSLNRVELVFGTLANYRTEGVDATKKSEYNATTYTCSNTYCHGYFKNGNTANTVKWTDGANGAKCGSCHGDVATGKAVPGGTHVNFPGVENCGMCHGSVVKYENNTYNFVNKAKHINGVIDYN